jgi:hypothetical protein
LPAAAKLQKQKRREVALAAPADQSAQWFCLSLSGFWPETLLTFRG